jgi:hypothetical protein
MLYFFIYHALKFHNTVVIFFCISHYPLAVEGFKRRVFTPVIKQNAERRAFTL